MVFVPLEGNLTPEEQHAKMMERLDEMSGTKTAKARRRAKDEQRESFSNSDIRIKYMRGIYSGAITASGHPSRKDAGSGQKNRDKYRSPMNRYGFLHEMCRRRVLMIHKL